MKLRKMDAPAYWSRWAVGELGTVERRGGFAAWTVLDREGRIVATMVRTRGEAVSILENLAAPC